MFSSMLREFKEFAMKGNVVLLLTDIRDLLRKT